MTQDKLQKLEESSQKEKPSSTVKPDMTNAKNTSIKDSARESQYSMESPVVLKGSDREKFVNTVLGSTFNPERVDKQASHIARKQINKVE